MSHNLEVGDEVRIVGNVHCSSQNNGCDCYHKRKKCILTSKRGSWSSSSLKPYEVTSVNANGELLGYCYFRRENIRLVNDRVVLDY